MTILDHTPCLKSTQAVELAESLYDVNVENAQQLVSERDQNFLLSTADGYIWEVNTLDGASHNKGVKFK